MPMPAVLATIAQEGQAAGSGGSGDPSIATGETGDYDNAFLVRDYNSSSAISPAGFTNDGSAFSSVSGQNWVAEEDAVTVVVLSMDNFQSSSNRAVRIFAYLREGGSGTSSPSWTLHSLTQEYDGTLGTLGGGCSAQLNTSSYNNYQDNTLATRGYTGIGAYVQIDAGGGRGGLTWGRDGAEMAFQVKGSIDGDQAGNLKIKFEWQG